METLEAIETRTSVRRFSDKDVEEEKLLAVLKAVAQAPSWANLQCWRFIVVRDAEKRRELSELSYVESFFAPLSYKANPAKKGLAEAPVVIVACADPTRSGTIWGQPYYMTDLGIASQNLMLAAHDLGLGTVFVGVYEEEGVRSLLGIPDSIRVVGLFPLGYPRDKKVTGPGRIPMQEIVFRERWGG